MLYHASSLECKERKQNCINARINGVLFTHEYLYNYLLIQKCATTCLD